MRLVQLTIVYLVCSYFEAVMCVAAIDSDYFKAPFSNHGESIGYLAPGDSILSLSNETDDAIKERSGCSMAAPHVAGIAAIFTSVSCNRNTTS